MDRSATPGNSLLGIRNNSVASYINESTLKISNEIRQKLYEYCRSDTTSSTKHLKQAFTSELLTEQLKQQQQKINSLLSTNKEHKLLIPSIKSTGNSFNVTPYYAKINCEEQSLPLLVKVFTKEGLNQSWMYLSFDKEYPDKFNCAKFIKLEKSTVSFIFTDSKSWTGYFNQSWIYVSIMTETSCAFELVCKFGKGKEYCNL